MSTYSYMITNKKTGVIKVITHKADGTTIIKLY
jgi:hypothetical protein